MKLDTDSPKEKGRPWPRMQDSAMLSDALRYDHVNHLVLTMIHNDPLS